LGMAEPDPITKGISNFLAEFQKVGIIERKKKTENLRY